MNSHRILAAALALILSTVAGAQGLPTKQIRVDSTLMILNAMTVEDYMNMELPPLDTLYYNAFSMSNAVKYYEEEVNYYTCAVRNEQMKPLEWLRFVTSASYGNTDIVGILRNEASYPIWMESSTRQRNFFFNVGLVTCGNAHIAWEKSIFHSCQIYYRKFKTFCTMYCHKRNHIIIFIKVINIRNEGNFFKET